MMYQDGSVSKNVGYQEICTEKFREAFSNYDEIKIINEIPEMQLLSIAE